MTNSVQTNSVQAISTALLTNPVTNPHNLDVRHLGYFGTGQQGITPQVAFDHFHGARNPFLPGSDQWVEYNALTIIHKEKEKAKWLKLPEFPAIVKPSKRRLSQPRFRLTFDTEADARLRLAGSFIFVGTNLLYVRDVKALDDDYLLILEDAVGKAHRVWYSSEAVDLRSPEPQYIVHQDRPAFYGRHPSRQQRQGVSGESAFIKLVGGQDYLRLHNFSWFMKDMEMENIVWNADVQKLMCKYYAAAALRMSKNVAFYRDNETVKAEFRGRYLGVVNDDTIKVAEVDRRPWIDREAKLIGCTLRV